MSSKTTKVGRSTSSGSFVKLRDGRKLPNPPSGGKFTKVEIRKAVQSAATQRAKAKTG